VSGVTALARLLPDFGPSRDHPAFRRLLAGGLLSGLGGSPRTLGLLNAAVGGGGPLGNVESGTVASLTTPVVSTVASLTTPVVSAVSGGLGCLAIAALIGWLCPAFARYRATAG